jgi:hypothetical protein
LLDHLEEKPEIMRAKMKDQMAQFASMQIWRLNIEEVSGKEGS